MPRETWLVGLRFWYAVETHEGLRLGSITRRFVIWPPGQRLVAECHSRNRILTSSGLFSRPPGYISHRSPPPIELNCECGIYAISHPQPLLHAHLASVDLVYGYVALWGRVLSMYEGDYVEYRGQYAYPQAFVILPEEEARKLRGGGIYYQSPMLPKTVAGTSDVLKQLAEAYGVPLLEGFQWETGRA